MGKTGTGGGVRLRQEPLLRAHDLCVRFRIAEGYVDAVSGFSCTITGGQTLAVIGESGCGKSVAAHAIMRILPDNAEISGETVVCGNDTGLLSESELRRVRGTHISILFQNPDRALNPLYRISRQIREPVIAHQKPYSSDLPARLLSFAGCEDPGDVSQKFPCQCSGGMNQRALLAVVTAPDPRILIADEPTKGLDRCRVGDVADSLCRMRSDNRGILLITHDITLARTLANHVLVMYAGEVVESGKVQDVLVTPRHPYTRSLLLSLAENGFVPIPGMSPALSDLPLGCRFASRCPLATDHCIRKHPDLITHEGWGVRCPDCW